MAKIKEEFLKRAIKYAEAKEEVFDKENSQKDRSKYLRIANKMLGEIKEIYRHAYHNNELKEIEEFMFHENKYIRCIAATYSLLSNPELAEKVLNDLLKLPAPNWVGPDARLSLEIWKKGLLIPNLPTQKQ
jgi:hypothetical protein